MFYKRIIYVCILYDVLSGVYGKDIAQYSVDVHENLTVPCGPLSGTALDTEGKIQSSDVMWVTQTRVDRQTSEYHVQDDGSLFLINVTRNDSGLYTCSVVDGDKETIRSKTNVTVRTPPPPLTNVVVHPSTILALILWEVNDTGGYPIIDFTAEYRLTQSNESWRPISPNHISPNSRQIDVYRLEPNTSYSFRVWGTNQLGRGEITEVEAVTLHNVEEIELARHFLAGTENFDTRVWVVAVGIVMGTLVILSTGTCYLLYIECRVPTVDDDEQEIIELVPNIILNPGFDADNRLGTYHADETSK